MCHRERGDPGVWSKDRMRRTGVTGRSGGSPEPLVTGRECTSVTVSRNVSE